MYIVVLDEEQLYVKGLILSFKWRLITSLDDIKQATFIFVIMLGEEQVCDKDLERPLVWQPRPS